MGRLVEKNLKKRSDRTDVDNTVSGEIWVEPYSSSSYKAADYTHASGRTHTRYVGWGIPNYHRRVRKGELMPHTPWYKYESIGSTTGSYDISSNSSKNCDEPSRWYATNSYCPYDKWMIIEDDLWPFVPDRKDIFVQEAASKIYSNNGHDTLTFLAELADVRHMFMDVATKLYRMKNLFQWRQIWFPKKWKSVANEWLSARYGWRTMLYDIEDLSKALSHIGKANKRKRFSERSGTKTSTRNVSEDQVEFAHFYLDRVVQDHVTVSLRGSVTADVWIPEFQFNPFVTAWEVIPLSFVLDWFVSVGKSIAAASFLALETAYSASWGFRVEMTRTFQSYIGEVKDTYCGGDMEQQGTSTASLEVRTPCSVPLTPHYFVRMNPAKILDLIGLIAQRT
jgi:hypothetical protein